LIILDVELGGVDGIAAAREIRDINDKVEIAFLSAHMSYSTEGYRVRAIRFIIKNKYDMHSYIHECLDCVIKNIDANERSLKLDFTIGQHTIPIAEIIYLKSAGNYTVFVLSKSTNEEYKIRYPLKRQSEIMESFDFIPINAKETVNLAHVKSVTRYIAVLDNGESHQISQKKYNEVLRSFTLYKGKHL
jgi:DNA-binding LytR/AlgR family response regulator